EPGKGPRVYVIDPSGGPRRPVTPEGKSVAFLVVSADGKRLALGLTDGALQVFPVEGGEPRSYPAPADSSFHQIPIAFSEDGRSLYVQQPAGVPGRIHRLDLATGRREVWREIVSPDSTGILGYGPSLVTPDGRAYVMSYRQMISTLF